jgi:hypothetical protein
MNKRIVFVMMACAMALAIAPRAFGQATASFSGTVVDKSGAAVSGATVKATSQDNGAVREAKTDDTGHYVMALMPRGNYTIRVEFQGFQPAESKDVLLQVDEQREIDFTIAPASVSSAVEVVATPVAVETTNATLGQVITSQEVAQLPLNGRDFVQLAILTPGTTAETNPNSFFTTGASSEVAARGSYSLSVGGSRPNSTDWLLDGVDNNELTAGGIAIFSSIDSIQEFKVLTYSYSAQFGTRAGPTVLVTTKSGSNQFHGSLFEFLRNTDLDARSLFATSVGKFNLNQYGGAIGGPIRRTKRSFSLMPSGKISGRAFRSRVWFPRRRCYPATSAMTRLGMPQHLDLSSIRIRLARLPLREYRQTRFSNAILPAIRFQHLPMEFRRREFPAIRFRRA